MKKLNIFCQTVKILDIRLAQSLEELLITMTGLTADVTGVQKTSTAYRCVQDVKVSHPQKSSAAWTRDIRRVLTLAEEKKNCTVAESSAVFFSDEGFLLEIKVPESGGRVEKHRIRAAWSPVWWFGWCQVICWSWSTVFHQESRVKAARRPALRHSP